MLISPASRMLQSGVVFCPLALLHPVKNVITPFAGLEIVQCADAGVFDFCYGHAVIRCPSAYAELTLVYPC